MKGKPKVVPQRRKREGKTDYKLRLKLVSSKKPRLIIRRTNQHVMLQVAEFHPDGDKILAAATTQDLKKHGWSGSTKNIPAAYLAGLLCGTRSKKLGVKSAIADLGLNKTPRGGVLYSALKGAVDGGLNVPHGEEIAPTEERLKGKHIADYAASLSKENYKKQFSKTKPEEIEKQFEKTKASILKEKQ